MFTKNAYQEDAGSEYGPGSYVVLVELIDYSDDSGKQYLFTDRNKARNFIFAYVREVFLDDPKYRNELKWMETLDKADELLGDVGQGFAIKDWVIR